MKCNESCPLVPSRKYGTYILLYICLFCFVFCFFNFYLFQTNAPFVECHNRCCESQPCLNGGTCHETCGVFGKRFKCECRQHASGRICETGKESTIESSKRLSLRLCLSVMQSVCLPVCVFVMQSVCLPVCLSCSLNVCLSVCLTVCLLLSSL